MTDPTIKLLIMCYRASTKRENIFNKARNCNGTGTPIANCNLLVGDSPQAVGFSPVGHLPVGQSPVGHSPVG